MTPLNRSPRPAHPYRASKHFAALPLSVVEDLEQRRMMSSSPVSLGRGGVLNVQGTRRADVITVAPDAQQGMVDVNVNGRVFKFSEARISKLSIKAGAGNDKVVVSHAINIPAYIDGGSGNDTIDGGGGNETLIGGSGNDLIEGGPRNNYIDGAAGNDTLIGGAGNDTLVAGSGSDFLNGGGGNNVERGGPGNDVLQGNSPGDQLIGGGRNNHFGFFGGDGANGIALNQLSGEVQNGLLDLAGGGQVATVNTFTNNEAVFFGTAVNIGGRLTEIAVDGYGNPCDCGGDFFNGGAGVNLLTIDQVPPVPRDAILYEANGDLIDLVEEFPASDGTLLYATVATDYYGDSRDIVVDENGYSLTDSGGDSFQFDASFNVGFSANARLATPAVESPSVHGGADKLLGKSSNGGTGLFGSRLDLKGVFAS